MAARPYMCIADELRQRIDTGELQPGDRIPSVRELADLHGVAQVTAHRAIRVLQSHGLVHSVSGIGTVVSDESARGWSAARWVERSRRSGRVYPPGQHAQIRFAGIVPAPDLVIAALGLDDNAQAIRRDRITFEGDKAVSASSSWFPDEFADSAPALLSTERIREGSFAYLAVTLGRRVQSWRDQYDPAIADAEEAALLSIDEGTPLHRGLNWIYDDNGDVLEFGQFVSTARIVYAGRIEI